MARQTIENRSTRKLLRMGKHSLAVTIPIEIVRNLKMRKGQKVVVEQKGKTITIKDWKKK